MKHSLALIVFSACLPVQSTMTTPPTITTPTPTTTVGDDRWFVTQTSATTGPQLAIAATRAGDRWLDPAGVALSDDYTHGVRTQPASPTTIRAGRPVIATCADAWYLLVARHVDAQTGTIHVGVDGNHVCPVDLAITQVRVIVEFKN